LPDLLQHIGTDKVTLAEPAAVLAKAKTEAAAKSGN